jgi:hypothetical protein
MLIGTGLRAWFLYGVRSSHASSVRAWSVTPSNYASWPVSERQSRRWLVAKPNACDWLSESEFTRASGDR